MDSSAAAAWSAIFAAGAAIMAPMPAAGADGLAWLRRCDSALRRCSSAQRLKRSEISCSLANACSVFFGAACAVPVMNMIAATAVATATRSVNCFRMALLLG